MENLKNVPRWFWYLLGAIIIITLLAKWYCKNEAIQTQLKSGVINSSPVTETAIDSVANIQSMQI